MSEETQVSVEETPQAVVTEPATTPPETTPAPVEEAKEAEAKSFTQAELDKIIQSEKAKAEAKAERRAMRAYKETLERLVPQQRQPEPQQVSDRPSQSQYANVDDYVEAMADWKLNQRDMAVANRQAQDQNRGMVTKTENIYSEAAKLPGFDREVFDELPLTPAIAAAIVDSDEAAKVMAFMSANPEEVQRIARLSPARQSAEIGKLEAKLASAPKVSNAPAPLKPVGSRGNVNNSDPSHMTMEEYAAFRLKSGARWARR